MTHTSGSDIFSDGSQANRFCSSSGVDKGKQMTEDVHVDVSLSASETVTNSTPLPSMPAMNGVDSDGNASLNKSISPGGKDLLGDPMNIDTPQYDESDLARSIKGTYRVLDLISEQGSSGLVDKIIISQDSLKAFINSVSPGAYASMTKVNFKALDRYAIKPVGIYGSKEQIVRFLSQLGAIDDAIAAQLLADPENQLPTRPILRSGLYVITTPKQTEGFHQIFVLYWPEHTTWDDSAMPSVRRNRITFMRYLTKMCDQVVSLISPEHAQSIQWNEEDDGNNSDNVMLEIEDESDRMFAFEVAQTDEQEESVTVHEGFKAISNVISVPDSTKDMDQTSLRLVPKPPYLLFGETAQGFMTAKYQESRVSHESLKWRSVTRLQLEGYLVSDRLCLNEQLDEVALEILLRMGLEKSSPDEYKQWRHDANAVQNTSDSNMKKEIEEMSRSLQPTLPALQSSIFDAILDEVVRIYPFFNRETFVFQGEHERRSDNPEPPLSRLLNSHPKANDEVTRQLRSLRYIPHQDIRVAKGHISSFKAFDQLLNEQSIELDEQTRVRALQSVLEGNVGKAKAIIKGNDMGGAKYTWLSSPIQSRIDAYLLGPSDMGINVADLHHRMESAVSKINYEQFWNQLDQDVERYSQEFPLLKEWADKAKARAHEYLQNAITKLVKKLTPTIQNIQEDDRAGSIRRRYEKRAKEEQSELRMNLIKRLNGLSARVECSHTLSIEGVREERQWYTASYSISGMRSSKQDPVVVHTIHLMNLTTQDQHELQLNPSAIPSPQFRYRHSFTLPLGYSVVRAQLLEGEKILLVIADRAGNLMVFLDQLEAIQNTIAGGRGKSLNREKIGRDFLLAYDELKKTLAVVSSSPDKLQLHVFMFDDSRRSFQAFGSSINLHKWYDEAVAIHHACFVSGSEELMLVDSQAQARVFSLVTLQFRPATLQLEQIPHNVSSTPDGACLLVSQMQGDYLTVTACHWSTFGSSEGTKLDLPFITIENGPVVTSLINRTAVHVVVLDLEAHACRSHALNITRKVTEFTFKQKNARGSHTGHKAGAESGGNPTAHNCLIGCHAEVWTRFPVLPAVQRETISSSSLRSTRTLVFVTDRDYARYAAHFAEMISTFERGTKKPTEDALKSIRVSAAPFAVFAAELCGDGVESNATRNCSWNVSEYRAGEWLVDLLCLIPIHLALAKNNRFVPLKDGVFSPELESSLLGADVNHIVDSLSFGWYESLFQSYMASKPVRVVSSMGEQSVGKSFALNHLVDTSFAGSAMRTTEGVWMSVTPTKDALIVALDFEGVHSIERSAQEDTLLVLFNTAISNLVLFRNNFALSRDITGLFQSFQSSSTVLDPKANPLLFQSTLVIIIKDVVDSDKTEIAKEFSLKFQRIVQDEQEANFISRLHAGRLNIIPWPVIESKEFYKLFPTLKRRLDQQVITHRSAGEFLHLMKTLMAKLKANDWGAMSQTMASHRAQLLSSLLGNALTFGYAEIQPEREHLKNLDLDTPIDMEDTPHQLFIDYRDVGDQSTSRESTLSALRMAWEGHGSRQHIPEREWMTGLIQYLENIVTLRIAHVREWLDQNLLRFQGAGTTSHASIGELKRRFEQSTVDLRGNVQLCGLACQECQLRCVQSRGHNGAHDCRTDHGCVHECDFCLEPEVSEHAPCMMSAGHAGKHICGTDQHLCGKSCKFSGRHGCQDVCTKAINHPEEEHLCAAPIHACGKPCNLSDLRLVDGSVYSCPGTCRVSSDTEHFLHQCDARFCTIQCQLCKRLCADQDHMHGLHSSAIHLCGQEHLCTALCAAPGICEIQTAPHSIEATFTGRNETFKYTKFSIKYTQDAKRLKCIKPIPPGATQHKGSHNHSLDENVVHFCQVRCENCNYFCTLPLGHPQREHETRHGSMSRTRWTVDGPDDVPLEIEGRKFSTNDEGAPMMCNLVCSAMGRHVHIDYCRADDETACTGNHMLQHLTESLHPDPGRPKDVLTHNLFWKRSGFKDPYSRDERANFAKCDSMCPGPEHTAAGGGTAVPSYCVLPLFHGPLNPTTAVGTGYISQDGHRFACRNPVVMQQAFHVIFAVDRSTSMNHDDRRPLPNTPVAAQISAYANNRYGAVLSSLHSFWMARAVAVTSSNTARRDAYSVLLFDNCVSEPIVNDFASTPDQLLGATFQHARHGGTDFSLAVQRAGEIMEQNWSTERLPIIIFLSDGECTIQDEVMQDLCLRAVRLGRAVSFHAVSFGPDAHSRYLRRMAQIAYDAQINAPRDPLVPTILSSYTRALNTVQLAETFLGIAESLRKPRGALMH